MGKCALILYAHPEPKSFNAALKNVAVETLTAQGHSVDVSDLYAMKFDPTISRHQFQDVQNKDHFRYNLEVAHAYKNGTLPDDVKTEVDKLIKADLIILQFPMFWLGLPAILKGWIDRCIFEPVAFELCSKWYDSGPFVNKKVVLSFTTGGPQGFYSNKGLLGDMDVILWPIHTIFRQLGCNVLRPQISYSVASVDDATRGAMLDDWKRRLENIGSESPLDFVHIRHFDPATGFQLSDDFVKKVNVTGKAPTSGQNLGLPLTPGSITSHWQNCILVEKL